MVVSEGMVGRGSAVGSEGTVEMGSGVGSSEAVGIGGTGTGVSVPPGEVVAHPVMMTMMMIAERMIIHGRRDSGMASRSISREIIFFNFFSCGRIKGGVFDPVRR